MSEQHIEGEPRAEGDGPAREPAVRAPAPVVALALALVVLYVLQSTLGDPDATVARFGFAPAELDRGRWTGLVTALFVHGTWAHVLINTLGELAFGAPVARMLGRGAGVFAGFLAFFILCGVLGSLGFAAFHPGAEVLLVGASGGVSGLMGAASRLMERRDALSPFTSRTVLGMAAAWVVVNLLLGMVGLGAVSGGAPIAWEAHLAGYAAGLLLIGPAAALARPRGVTKL